MPAAREQESILICTQCGHINPASNKFCGNCGNGLVSLHDSPPMQVVDNRKVVDSRVESMPDITAPPAPAPEPVRRPQIVTREVQPAAVTETFVEPAPAPRYEPVSSISGPSFLGLGSDPTATADYLLTETEERKPRTFRVLMILAIIALIIVGALEWRAIQRMVKEQGARLEGTAPSNPTQGQPPASSSDATAPPQQPGAVDMQVGSQAGSATADSNLQQQHPLVDMDSLSKQTVPAASQPSATGTSKPAEQDIPAQNAAPTQSTPAPKTDQPATPRANQTAPEGAASQASAPNKTSKAKVEPASETKKSIAPPKPSKAVQEPAKEKLDPAKDPNVVKGEKYLYGRGVPQSCSVARSLFQEAANNQNPSAMAHLGAMYATGQCVSANKTMAYMWFSKAYDANPKDAWLEKNLTMLWRDMSQSERQAVLEAKSNR